MTPQQALTSPTSVPPPEQMPTAHATFVEAEATINGPRRGAYGGVHDSFARIAQMWTLILGHEVHPNQIALCMIALKMCREVNSHKHDNLVDIMGYTGLLAELHGGEK